MLVGECGSGVRAALRPECRLGARVPVLVGPGSAWSGQVGQGAQAGEDLGEQVIVGW